MPAIIAIPKQVVVVIVRRNPMSQKGRSQQQKDKEIPRFLCVRMDRMNTRNREWRVVLKVLKPTHVCETARRWGHFAV